MILTSQGVPKDVVCSPTGAFEGNQGSSNEGCFQIEGLHQEELRAIAQHATSTSKVQL